MAGFDGTFSSYNEDIETARGGDIGLGDYIVDLPVGAVKGLSQAVQGLLQLGAMPIDYLADTNLLAGIESVFEKITPKQLLQLETLQLLLHSLVYLMWAH